MLDAVRERVQSADDIVAIEPEVEREMVASPGRDADVCNVVLHRDACEERLRAVTPGHADHVRATRARALGKLSEVASILEQHRLDTALLRLGCEVEAFGLPAAGPRVDDQHPAEGPRRRPRMAGHHAAGRLVTNGVPCGDPEQGEQHGQQEEELQVITEGSADQDDEREHADREDEPTSNAAPRQHEPRACGDRAERQQSGDQVVGALHDRVEHREGNDDRREERDDRSRTRQLRRTERREGHARLLTSSRATPTESSSRE